VDELRIVPWREVEPLGELNGALAPLLATVDTLRGAWKEFIEQVSEEEFAEARRRSLRRHAIETGIIERLYDVSWGVTEALVAEGLTLEAAEREGGLDDAALATIRAQFDALELIASVAREGRDLTVFFVKQLHDAITRNQATYDATDALGRAVQLPLQHGEWKSQPNHVVREDGSLLQYTPPEHVQAEMERLIALSDDTADAHPLVRASWLHHRFIRIHPFEDGNGRVARALVLLVLLRADYAPLVVDRTRRADYLRALDAANDGDLSHLVRLFGELEIVALRSELERPAAFARVGTGPVEVARGYAERLRGIQIGSYEARATAVASLAEDVQQRVEIELRRLGGELRDAFVNVDPIARMTVAKAAPPEPAARWWYAQLVRAAQAANFFANLSEGSWWVRLGLVVLGHELRFGVAIQKVGHGETGVLAVTTFAELVPPRDEQDESRPLFIQLFSPTSGDSVTLNQNDSVEDRWQEICDLIERTLSASVAEFGRLLG
jgi:Fic family protein